MLIIFEHPETLERKTVHIRDGHKIHYTDPNGVEWEPVDEEVAPDNRSEVFALPYVTVKGNSDPFSQRAFVEETARKRGTVGDMMDYSRELSEKRAQKNGGVDPVQTKFFKDYQKKIGKKHLSDPSRIDKSKLKNSFVSVTD